MKGWLGAFFDGEGGVYYKVHPKGKGCIQKFIRCCNTCPDLINRASTYLNALGIHHDIRVVTPDMEAHRRKAASIIQIVRATDILKYAELIGFHCRRKQGVLNDIVEYIKKRRAVIPSDALILQSRKRYKNLLVTDALKKMSVDLRKQGYVASYSYLRKRLMDMGVYDPTPREKRLREPYYQFGHCKD